jgi:anti-anti-sigma factor
MRNWHVLQSVPTVSYLGDIGEAVVFPAGEDKDYPSNPTSSFPGLRTWLGPLAGWVGKKRDPAGLRTQYVSRLIDHALQHGIRAFIFDLHEVRYLNSSGLSDVVKWYTSIRKRDGFLALANANERTRWIFETTQLEKVFALFDSVDDAHEYILQSRLAEDAPHPNRDTRAADTTE